MPDRRCLPTLSTWMFIAVFFTDMSGPGSRSTPPHGGEDAYPRRSGRSARRQYVPSPDTSRRRSEPARAWPDCRPGRVWPGLRGGRARAGCPGAPVGPAGFRRAGNGAAGWRRELEPGQFGAAADQRGPARGHHDGRPADRGPAVGWPARRDHLAGIRRAGAGDPGGRDALSGPRPEPESVPAQRAGKGRVRRPAAGAGGLHRSPPGHPRREVHPVLGRPRVRLPDRRLGSQLRGRAVASVRRRSRPWLLRHRRPVPPRRHHFAARRPRCAPGRVPGPGRTSRCTR